MDTIIMTKELFEAGMSRRGGYNAKQLKCLGVKTIRFNKGWKRSLIGKRFPAEVVDRFLKLKDAHLKPDPLLDHLDAIAKEGK